MIPHNKLPPTFSRGRLAPAIAGHRVHSSHSSFSRRSFFEASPCRRPAVIDRRYRSDSNEVEWANILAPGFRVPAIAGCILLPAFTSELFGDWPWEVVSSYSSATAPESHGNSSHQFH